MKAAIILRADFTHIEVREYTKDDLMGFLEGKYTLKELIKGRA